MRIVGCREPCRGFATKFLVVVPTQAGAERQRLNRLQLIQSENTVDGGFVTIGFVVLAFQTESQPIAFINSQRALIAIGHAVAFARKTGGTIGEVIAICVGIANQKDIVEFCRPTEVLRRSC